MADTDASPTHAGFELPDDDDTPPRDAPLAGLAAFGLGALAAIGWLAALLLDLQTTHLPGWAREAPHAALVLAVPALVILPAQIQSRRGAIKRLLSSLALLLVVIASLPGLLLINQSQDFLTLFLRVPTLGLGIALGYVVSSRRPPGTAMQRSVFVAALGGAGFGLVVLLVGLAFAAYVVAIGPSSHSGLLFGVVVIFVIVYTLITLLLGVFAATLGGVLAPVVAQFGR